MGDTVWFLLLIVRQYQTCKEGGMGNEFFFNYFFPPAILSGNISRPSCSLL